MLLELIIALVVGIIAGTFTGLFPGIHINLVSAGLLALLASGQLSFFEPIALVIFVVAMSITHTFIDFIPSVFLGAPEEDSFLAVLPGHQLLVEGKGYEAVVMTLYGGLMALPVLSLLSLLFIFFLEPIYAFILPLLPFILIFVSLYLVFSAEEWIVTGMVFVLSGFLGLLTFHLPVREPLLPLLSGLFGISSLLVSLKDKVSIPTQNIRELRAIGLPRRLFWKSALVGTIAAPLFSFLPAMGSGHAAVVGSELSKEVREDRRSFLFLVGMINTVVMALSFVTAFAIEKTRTGSAVAVQEILETISLSNLFVILIVVFISGVCAFFLGLFIARFFSRRISRVPYQKISVAVIGILFLVTMFLSNWIGLIVLITASALGVFCILSGVSRIQMMGALLIPTIVYYLF